MFWHTSQRDYVAAIVSLTKIARFNGLVLSDVFREAGDFLSGKSTKGVQCDFQPLARLGERSIRWSWILSLSALHSLEDVKLLSLKYPDFDMVNLQAVKGESNHLCHRLLKSITHPNYQPTLSTFYPTDFLRSAILSIYLLVMCGLWSVLLQRARFFDDPLSLSIL